MPLDVSIHYEKQPVAVVVGGSAVHTIDNSYGVHG
jgi:hypothetical protein